jgi:hypothetical protein
MDCSVLKESRYAEIIKNIGTPTLSHILNLNPSEIKKTWHRNISTAAIALKYEIEINFLFITILIF